MLESNPTTGYSWSLAQSEELFRVETAYTENDREDHSVGAGGTESFTLTPLKAGKTEVTLTYARPWEGGEQADRIVYTFEIDKDLQVKQTDGYSTGVAEPVPVPTPEIG